ncbi:hypothetical protein NC653_021501 [Populus alba x Populus x berolinensis]|uniref:Uncharacterized protein n=1 Tax=Populus alba x Populus x berolinensis TaxID=444605 RepID=A0AAD6MNL6_9ROSI|nr:hypothetical protein NC653_021501 [Populus alba x Populus x berolinensis]
MHHLFFQQVKRLVVTETEKMYKARKQNEANHRAVRPPLVINHLPTSCKHFHLESAFLLMQIFGEIVPNCASTKQGAQEMRIHKSESSGQRCFDSSDVQSCPITRFPVAAVRDSRQILRFL